MVGENGAGKSTLMNILAGDLQPIAASIRIDGSPAVLAFAARQPGRRHRRRLPGAGALPDAQCRRKHHDVRHAPPARMLSLVPRADRCGVEARAALARLGMGGARPRHQGRRGCRSPRCSWSRSPAQSARRPACWCSTSPTRRFRTRESQRLFEIVRQLRAEGVTVIYVSHHLQEVLAIADRITVMRDGRTIETIDNDGMSPKTA